MGKFFGKKEIEITPAFQLYEKGKNFLSLKDYYTKVKKFIDFYQGNQWDGAELGDIPGLTYNFIKPIVKYKTSNLDTYDYQIVFLSNNYNSPEDNEEMEKLCQKLNSHVAVIWEHKKIDAKIRRMKKLAAITGEGILYFYFKKDIENNASKDTTSNEEDTEFTNNVVNGEIEAEIIHTTDIYYGNENDSSIENQPYILIKQRCPLVDVLDEARKNEISEEEISKIIPDKEVDAEVSEKSKNEVNEAVLCITKLYKKNGTVHCLKTTRNVVIQNEKDLGLKRYPIAHYIWEEDIGSARGLGEVEPLIANQIEANRTLVRRALIIKMIAYPKPVVNTEYIKNPSAINKIGATIELKGAPENINNYFGYIQPTQTSSEAVTLQNELIQTSRELANASEIATGAINPEKAAGKAILAVKEASQQPLTEHLSRYKDTLEDIGLIIFDIWRTYNTNGMNVYAKEENSDLVNIDDGSNKYTLSKVTNEQLEKLKPYIKIEITPKSAYDKFAQEQSYENLLVKGIITFEEYVELLDVDSSMNKRALVKLIQKRIQKQKEIEAIQMNAQKQKDDFENKLKTEAIANQVDTDVQIDNIGKQTELEAQNMLGGM